MSSDVLCLILARAGSKGLPGKNTLELCGRAMIEHTLDHALAAKCTTHVALSTDDPVAAEIARRRSIEVIERPADLASDIATVDAAARHAVRALEQGHYCCYDAVVILYANVPLRPAELIDRAVAKLMETGCDSVQSVCPVGKMHPYWMKRVGGPAGDVLEHYQANHVYRRQDLPPVYMLDGGIIAVTRASLFTVNDGEPHAFLGIDRRALVTQPGEVVDVDTAEDLEIARTMLSSQSPVPPLSIRGRVIGSDHPAYIIAELGVNHDGSLDRALELTRAAKEAGADAVKLQLFEPRKLLSAEAEFAAYQQGIPGAGADPFEMLDRLQLSAKQMIAVRELACELDLGFIVTCFSLELVADLRELNVDVVKIASPDAVNLPLIETLVRELPGKPLLISTGTCEINELRPAVSMCGDRALALLHCVSAYPVPDDQVNLGRIGLLSRTFGRPVGYSDHSTALHAGALAAAIGACVIEKHLTYDRGATGPDHAASFDPREFAEYVRLIRSAEAMTAAAPQSVPPVEADVRRVSRQSVCVARDLPAGHVLTRADVTVKRPGIGLPAAMLPEVIGRRLHRAVEGNHLLRANDLANDDTVTAAPEAIQVPL